MRADATYPPLREPAHVSARTMGVSVGSFGVALQYVLLGLMAVVAIFPFYWMVVGSFMALGDLFSIPPKLLPPSPSLNNYVELFQRIPFARNMINSVVISMLGAVIGVVLATLAGFAFSKYRFPGREILFYGMIATL